MIRRKLTRIEVTLDDTKDLDEYFSKVSNNSVVTSNQTGATGTAGGVATTPACSSKIPSQLYQLYTKHYAVGAGTNQTTLDISFDPQYTSLTAPGTSSNTQQTRAASDSNNYPNDSIGALVTNFTASGDHHQQQQLASESDRLSYNPQPHNQFNRFNQNI